MKYKPISGKVMLYSLRTHCYLSKEKKARITYWKKQNMKSCELWHEREHDKNILRDVHNGNVWKRFEEPIFNITVCKRLRGCLVTIFFITTSIILFIVRIMLMY